MIIRGNIRGQKLSFVVSTALEDEETRVRAHVRHLEAALQLIPLRHLMLLNQVPIVIWQRPRGERGKGGWVSPAEGNRLYDAWLNGRRGERLMVQDDLNAVPHAGGIIHMTDVALFRTVQACQLTLLHETGHCVDYHLDLNSTPTDGDQSYRRGNRPYQGQLYPNTGYNPHEFKAETYSRLFIRPNALCRRERANPPCEHSRHHRRCNERIRRDLANSRAFRSLASDVLADLRINAASGEAQQPAAGAPGPLGVRIDGRAGERQLLALAAPRRPGPLG